MVKKSNLRANMPVTSFSIDTFHIDKDAVKFFCEAGKWTRHMYCETFSYFQHLPKRNLNVGNHLVAFNARWLYCSTKLAFKILKNH